MNNSRMIFSTVIYSVACFFCKPDLTVDIHLELETASYHTD
jgi:hypothetical protein